MHDPNDPNDAEAVPFPDQRLPRVAPKAAAIPVWIRIGGAWRRGGVLAWVRVADQWHGWCRYEHPDAPVHGRHQWLRWDPRAFRLDDPTGREGGA